MCLYIWYCIWFPMQVLDSSRGILVELGCNRFFLR
ncbi:hypothetical protein CASFOL_036532 [Castilleja foliolosa]|uniref:Uncharacterized protein n=1 Tax=Castilleja foliolosa TaxID=1961234 RepID=A0ABD3BVT5_9LAMI